MVNYNKKYFLMSFRFDKNKPEDFKLVRFDENKMIFTNIVDNSKWLQRNLYDFGWGNEYGFVKLPNLDFDDLWALLTNSDISENKFGSAYILVTDYPDKLKRFLLEVISNPNFTCTESMKEAYKTLKLNTVKNRSPIIGKSITEISENFEDWKFISNKVNKLLK